MRLFNAAVLLASGRRSLLSLNILVGTDAGASYGESEYAHGMKAAGFAEVCRINLPGPAA